MITTPYLPPYQQAPAIHRNAEKQSSDYQKQQERRSQEECKRQLAAEMRRRTEQTKQKR